MAKAYEIAFALSSSTAKFTSGFQAASRTVSRLQESFKALEGAARQSRALAEMQGKVQASGRAYREAVAHVQSLRQAMQSAGPPTRAQAQALDKANTSAQKAKESLQRTAERMRALAQSAGVAGSGIQRFIQQEQALTAAAGRAGQALAKQQAMEARLGKARAGVASAAPYAQQAGSAMGRGLLSMMTDGAQLERQLSMVRGVSRASDEEMAKYKAQAMQLGATTRYTSTQVAEGMQYLAMAGFSTQDVLKAMPGMLDLASAGATDLGRTADIASNILSGMGMQAEEMGRVGDVLTNAFQHGNTNLETLGETMKYCAPVAKQFGLSIEETATYATILGSAGLQGSLGGTALRGIMLRLTKPTKQVSEALKELGVRTYDAQGKFKPLHQILKEVAEAQDRLGLKDVGKTKSMAMIFGTEAFSGGANLIESIRKGDMARLLAGAGERGTAKATAEEQDKNLIGKLLGLMSAVSGVNTTIYDTISAKVQGVVVSVTQAVQAFNKWLAANPEVARGLAVAGAAIAALASAALPCAVAVKSLAFVFGIFKVAALGVWAALGPVGIAIAALIAIGVALYANWEAISAWASKWWSAISVAVSIFCIEAGQWLHQTWDGVAAWFAGVWAGVQASFQDILNFVTGTFTAAWSSAWQGVQNIFSSMWDGLKGIAEGVLNWLIGKLNSVIGMVNSTIEVMNKIPGVDIGKLDAIPTSGQKVPAMAAGGIVMDPTLAMVGEGGGPEAVVPLDRLSSMLSEFAPSAGAGAGASPVTVQVTNNVTVGAGSGDVYGEVRRGLDASANDMARTLERLLQNQRRLSYA